ncbi:MAG: helix-turn-helix transcriptional regulator [Chloroflexi bacterium]|nr:helix-turn-helix transcriptional regulator [Chloroflexota bacterium]
MRREIPIPSRFGARIRALRLERGWSQEELAERADLDRTYISGIERGLRNVALRNIEQLANAFGISLEELFQDL